MSAVGMMMTACGPVDDGTEDGNGNGNQTEQPGGGNDNPDDPNNPGSGDDNKDEIPADKTQAIKFQDE
ncbi:MAG: hypothetical protein IJA66_01600, partial [Alistipes sp.]|nr:hypothetical protein [Alistipes sp.]